LISSWTRAHSSIGAGGMGEVYHAKDTRLDRIVAITSSVRGSCRRAELRERFEREAKAISSLNHPYICTLYDVGHQDGIEYLVMEYVERETLAARLAKGPLPREQVLRYAIEIANALDKAHRKGVTHRDLKPGNVMLTKSGSKLLDLGLAKRRKDTAPATLLSQMPTGNQPITAQGAILGTLQYMAPEQLEGKEAHARTDIFAFGVVVFGQQGNPPSLVSRGASERHRSTFAISGTFRLPTSGSRRPIECLGDRSRWTFQVRCKRETGQGIRCDF
jgi:serine/threonine protein kinase